ncbi:MAG: CDP-diacylglycerol--glycerol-3-phosphate 3-phosphatidyltransferase [Clostridia bacterium]|nr:CDP-diacylglycerol--glycerol-3-phosphate 3-phosphatidyltransferase [Clostridia bacterium]
MNLPNKITLTRIFMIPVFVAVFYCGILSPWCFLASAVVFLGAALTDALDGHIARSRHLVTDLGKFLDPIADKVLVSTAFIVLLTIPTAFTVNPFGAYGLIVAGVLVALVLARELIVSGFRIIAAGKHLVLAADKLGKIKTVFQDIAIALLLASMSFMQYGLAGEIIAYIGLACFVICALMTVVSGVNYLVKNKEVLKDKKAEEGEGENS